MSAWLENPGLRLQKTTILEDFLDFLAKRSFLKMNALAYSAISTISKIISFLLVELCHRY